MKDGRPLIVREAGVMPRVIMQPSFGHGAPRERWMRTLAAEIKLRRSPIPMR
jgi:hypothetical protein